MAAVVAWITLAMSIYWGLFDTQHPLEFIKGEAIYNAETHQMQPIWHVIRNRHCPGTRYAWIKDGFLQNVPDLKLPANAENIGEDIPGHDFILKPLPISVDPRILDSFDYITEVDYKCNLWQRWISPLVVYPPTIHVTQGGN